MRVLVIRLGAFGDCIFLTALLKRLKEDGHYVALNCKKPQFDAVLKGNPNIDKVIFLEGEPEGKDYDRYWANLSKDYDKTINLTGSIEDRLLMREGTIGFNWPKEKRHALCNINYYDQTLKIGGYEPDGFCGEMFFSPLEIQEAKRFRRKYAGKYLILWSLSGSSFHKAYPYMEDVMKGILAKYQDIVILAVGDAFCRVFESGLVHDRIKNYVAKWSMRKTLLMTKFVDLVVGTETGVLVGAGCFDTPKVILLSHSSEENLTKYWKNVMALQAPVHCAPCHRLIYTKNACELEPGPYAPICMGRLPARMVFEAIEEKYQEKKHGIIHRLRNETVLCGR